MGNSAHPKEHCEIFFDGKVIELNDYKSINAKGVKVKDVSSPEPEKGQLEELEVFARLIAGKPCFGISLEELVETTELSFKARDTNE
jgi:hypothetical protein